MIANDQDWIEIGTIVGAQGLKGELRVYPNSDFPERFEKPGTRWLKDPRTSEIKTIKLLAGRYLPGKNLYIIKIDGVSDRTQAEAFKNHILLVEQGDRPKLAEDEYHIADLVGLEVYNQVDGQNIGIVIDVYSAGNDILEIQLHKQPEASDIDTSLLKSIEPPPENLYPRKTKIPRQKPQQPKIATILIPFVKEIVPVVDIAANRIEIDPPSGLLDLQSL